ncbi:MAG: hypothetical protein ACOYM0_01340 [Bacteroidales bacterium]
MAKEDCLLPVTIGGIKITNDLIYALDCLSQDHGIEDMHFFTGQCLILSSIELEQYGLDRKLFLMLRGFYTVLQALNEKQEGGGQ